MLQQKNCSRLYKWQPLFLYQKFTKNKLYKNTSYTLLNLRVIDVVLFLGVVVLDAGSPISLGVELIVRTSRFFADPATKDNSKF
jgi:hypothetical protein